MSTMDNRLQAAREAGLRGQHQQAVDLCVAVLQEKPGDPTAVAFLGLSLWRASAFAQAVDVLQQALRHFTAQEELNVALLDSWRALGQQELALQFAAKLSDELLARPMLKSWKAALKQGVDALGPGVLVEDRLSRLFDHGLFEQAEQELAPQIQAHPRWGRGQVLRAWLMFGRSGRGVPAEILLFPKATTEATDVEARWRSALANAMSDYRGKIVAQLQTALKLLPDDSQALSLLARMRFEEGQGKAEVAAVAAQRGSQLLGPFPLRAAIDPRLAGVAAVKLLEPATTMVILEPRSAGAYLDVTGAAGPALTCARYVGDALDAKVAAGSDVVLFKDGSALCDPLTHALGELTDYFSDSWIALGSTREVMLRDLPVVGVSGTAISLLGASARFYGHWLLDHLLRLRAIDQHPGATQASVLVEDGMPASHYEALRLLLGPDAVIRRIAPGHCVQVDRVLFAGPDVFFPHLMRRDLPPMASVAPSSIDGLAYLRERMLAALGRPGRQGRRILVRRRSSTRRVLNEDEVCRMLVSRWGFEEVYPETLGFADQVRRFHDADVVVGAQGSALSNCVFCAPGTRVIAMCSGFAANFPSWAHALQSLGMQHCFVVGEAQQNSHFLAIQCDFRVDPEALGNALAGLGVAPLTA
ncbi:glycosyltransferase 61 family protein [Roseateles sp. P5_E4]